MNAQAKPNRFALPQGATGRLAGGVMAVVNADMERAAINAFGFEGNERVLEIGFGPGVGIRYLMRRLPWGFAAGVDPSEVMVRQARRRNHRGVRSGLVHLRLGDASHLPWPDSRFDAVASVNNVMLWDPLDTCLSEVRRVLKPEGWVSIAVHERACDADFGERLTEGLWRAGFTSVRTRRRRSLSGRALFVIACAS